MLVKTFNNSKVRVGEKVTNPKMHVQQLFHWIYERFQKDIDSKKTEKGKAVGEETRKKIAKMNQAGHISTFIKTANGFKTTGVEGFVAIDHLKGGAVKVVDRMEFSKNNFSAEIIKGWQR
jgi:adenine C2-methylase RlmN of 23S rRNA A2503 and tRNA A37